MPTSPKEFGMRSKAVLDAANRLMTGIARLQADQLITGITSCLVDCRWLQAD